MNMQKITFKEVLNYYKSKYDNILYNVLNKEYWFTNKNWEILINNVEKFENDIFNFIRNLGYKEINRYIDYVFIGLSINDDIEIINDILNDLFELNIFIDKKFYLAILKIIKNKFYLEDNWEQIFYTYIKKSTRLDYLLDNKLLYQFIKDSIKNIFEIDRYEYSYYMNKIYMNYKWLSQQEYNSKLIEKFNMDIKKLLYTRNWDFLETN